MSALVLLTAIGGSLLIVLIAMAGQSAPESGVETTREWRLVRLTWVAALVVGSVVTWLVDRSLDLGRGTMLVPALLGLFVVCGVGLAEAVVRPRRPAGRRTASLTPRRVAAYLPRNLKIAVGAITVVHLLTLVLTTASASADDVGRAGRQIAAQCGNVGGASGPFPGSFYSVPLALTLLVIGLAAAVALVAVVRRPRGFAPDDAGDDVLRRRSTTRILAAVGAVVAASHTGIAFFAGSALLRMDCQRPWMDPAGWLLLVTMPAALLLMGWFVGQILAPRAVPAASPRHPAETP